MNKAEVKELLKEIVVAYPNFEVPEPRFMLWCELMADISFKTARERLREHIKTNRFPPTIADIRQKGKPFVREAETCSVTGQEYELFDSEMRRIGLSERH